MSLVSLAKEKNLPPHQYMDQETIDWIAANNPFSLIKNPLRFDIKDIESLFKIVPHLDWFLNSNLANSLHGFRHLLRVTIFSFLLINYNRQEKIDFDPKNLLTAAVLHDIRREHDKDDDGHGQRAANWFLDHIPEISKLFNFNYTDKDKEQVYSAICYHDISYDILRKDNVYLRNQQIIDFLKTADALDRYRLPKIKWWFDPNMVKIMPSQGIMAFAFDLILRSEQKYLKEMDGIASVMDLLKYDI